MKILFILLFSLSLQAFESNKLYECASIYRVVGGTPHEYSLDEQKKSIFQLIFNKKQTRLQTSDSMIYEMMNSKLKGKLYVNKKRVNGRNLTYKMKLASTNGLYKSVFVTGYGNLVNEYVLCHQVKKGEKE